MDGEIREKNSASCTAGELSARLNRIEGQVRGIKGMIESGECCHNVLNQILAARAALNSVAKIVLGNYINSCLCGERESSKIADEILGAVGKLL